MRDVLAAMFASVLALGTVGHAAADAKAGPAPHETAWFARWGVTPDDRGDALLKKSKIGSRMAEAISAARAGDRVAAVLVLKELERRCWGAERIGRAECGALTKWYGLNLPANNMPESPATKSFFAYQRVSTPKATEIGKAFDLGVGGPADAKVAEWFYDMAIRERETTPQKAEANYRMALLWESGRLGRVDHAQARKHYEAAGDLGHGASAYRMAQVHLKETKPESKDYAAYAFQSAADAGIADAAWRYAQMLETGQVVHRNGPTKLYKYYLMGAQQGHVPSMAGVARAYWNGWGVAKDEAAAESWWKRAALAGDPEASWIVSQRLARRNDFGGGLPWLRRAAEGGYPGASALLDQWVSNGAREKSLGGAVMSVFKFAADIAVEYDRQLQQELAVQRAQDAEFAIALYNSGYWSAPDQGGAAAGAVDAGRFDAGGSSAAGSSAADQAELQKRRRWSNCRAGGAAEAAGAPCQ